MEEVKGITPGELDPILTRDIALARMLGKAHGYTDVRAAVVKYYQECGHTAPADFPEHSTYTTAFALAQRHLIDLAARAELWLQGQADKANFGILAEVTCPHCGDTIHGTRGDIDSGLRKHIEYCPDLKCEACGHLRKEHYADEGETSENCGHYENAQHPNAEDGYWCLCIEFCTSHVASVIGGVETPCLSCGQMVGEAGR